MQHKKGYQKEKGSNFLQRCYSVNTKMRIEHRKSSSKHIQNNKDTMEFYLRNTFLIRILFIFHISSKQQTYTLKKLWIIERKLSWKLKTRSLKISKQRNKDELLSSSQAKINEHLYINFLSVADLSLLLRC